MKTSSDAPDSRPFWSYTAADHARVSYAETAWTIVTRGYEAVLPEKIAREAPVPALTVAGSLANLTTRLQILAVVYCHESGSTWERIGRALDVSRQSAHERYAHHVAGFHADLVAVLGAIEDGASVQDAVDALPYRDSGTSQTLVIDTAWYAPKLDAWLAETGRLPGSMNPSASPGELLARLSDPATSTGYRGGSARGVNARSPQCPFTADFPDADEPGGYLTCTLHQGHGGRHHLAVAVLEELWRDLSAGDDLIDRADSLTRLNRQKGAGIASAGEG